MLPGDSHVGEDVTENLNYPLNSLVLNKPYTMQVRVRFYPKEAFKKLNEKRN